MLNDFVFSGGKFLKWVLLCIIFYLQVWLVPYTVEGCLKQIFYSQMEASFNCKFLLNFSSCIPQLLIEKAAPTVLVHLLAVSYYHQLNDNHCILYFNSGSLVIVTH